MKNHSCSSPARMVLAFAALWAVNALAVETVPPNVQSDSAKPSIIIARPPVRPFHVEVWTDRQTYYAGQHIRIYFNASRDCYLYVFDTDTRGMRRQIFPNYYDRNNFLAGGRTFYIPDESYSMRVTGPSGRETLDAVAVAERYPICRPLDRFDKSDPFPLREQGAEPLLKSLREGRAPEKSERGEPQSKESPLPKAPEEKAPRREGGAQGIIIEPPDRGYQYAEAHTSFFVRGMEPEPMGMGRLRISSDPSSAWVYLDGERRGQTPLTIRDIPYGTHVVRLTKRGYLEKEQYVDIDGDTTGYIQAQLIPVSYK